MRRRTRDRFDAGESKLIPRLDGESWQERHQTRKDQNLMQRMVVEEWCARNNFELEVKNDGHHWIFKRGNLLVEWWTSSAKMVINKRWGSGIHVHDWEQAIREIEKAAENFRNPFGEVTREKRRR